ncbi:basic proline-rich protein-like [Neovison vison]|uniref:basic proline-rich protein-like n=1 Tax=Neovison vison TaxID=452646 RepID=UPI001CF048ED|nr:basic proline-rich protein-like [Neogale vison]
MRTLRPAGGRPCRFRQALSAAAVAVPPQGPESPRPPPEGGPSAFGAPDPQGRGGLALLQREGSRRACGRPGATRPCVTGLPRLGALRPAEEDLLASQERSVEEHEAGRVVACPPGPLAGPARPGPAGGGRSPSRHCPPDTGPPGTLSPSPNTIPQGHGPLDPSPRRSLGSVVEARPSVSAAPPCGDPPPGSPFPLRRLKPRQPRWPLHKDLGAPNCARATEEDPELRRRALLAGSLRQAAGPALPVPPGCLSPECFGIPSGNSQGDTGVPQPGAGVRRCSPAPGVCSENRLREPMESGLPDGLSLSAPPLRTHLQLARMARPRVFANSGPPRSLLRLRDRVADKLTQGAGDTGLFLGVP